MPKELLAPIVALAVVATGLEIWDPFLKFLRKNQGKSLHLTTFEWEIRLDRGEYLSVISESLFLAAGFNIILATTFLIVPVIAASALVTKTGNPIFAGLSLLIPVALGIFLFRPRKRTVSFLKAPDVKALLVYKGIQAIPKIYLWYLSFIIAGILH
ncbi:MAG: hypothetical protein M1150_02795 [Patescibacteria group bacterium]|nr:hypothetical protein [Patescibacteria group bacterium]